MDWYAWLCRAGLHPDVAFEYAHLFARNELAAADVRHLDHDFLATMGVPIAKHRLEILKLAKREKPQSSSVVVHLPWRATRLLAAAVRRSALSLADRLRSVARRDKAAVAVAPRPLPPPQLWKPPRARAPPSAAAMRNGGRKMALLRHLRKPMLTNHSGGGGKRTTTTNGAATTVAAAAAITGCFVANPDAYSYSDDEAGLYDDGEDIMRWESMFQDLKPT
uniref:SAM domain-containing protein n=1 Tax=Oryza punctata TaxID=4537 RepID=A0A0E0L8J5_ORYPU